jgi:hypothetical protein
LLRDRRRCLQHPGASVVINFNSFQIECPLDPRRPNRVYSWQWSCWSRVSYSHTDSHVSSVHEVPGGFLHGVLRISAMPRFLTVVGFVSPAPSFFHLARLARRFCFLVRTIQRQPPRRWSRQPLRGSIFEAASGSITSQYRRIEAIHLLVAFFVFESCTAG